MDPNSGKEMMQSRHSESASADQILGEPHDQVVIHGRQGARQAVGRRARLGIEVQVLGVSDLVDEALEENVQRKLTVRNKGEIAAWAWRAGIVTGRPRVSPAWLQ